jgi:hypothetical protein
MPNAEKMHQKRNHGRRGLTNRSGKAPPNVQPSSSNASPQQLSNLVESLLQSNDSIMGAIASNRAAISRLQGETSRLWNAAESSRTVLLQLEQQFCGQRVAEDKENIAAKKHSSNNHDGEEETDKTQ